MTALLDLAGSKAADNHAAHAALVFVVDDEPMMAFLIGAAIEGAGYRAHVFTDGAEALAMAETVAPDLLLVDLTMPKLTGAATIARLRLLHPTARALVISGVSKEEARAAAPQADGYIEKPFKFEALLEAVASALLPVLRQ